MKHLIEHIFTSTRLFLLWQAPEGADRSHFVVGELRDEEGGISFRYLTNTEDLSKAVTLGFECYPAFRKQDRIYTEGVMDSFMRRLPPRKRGDFTKYLEQWRLTADATGSLSDFALLAYTGGKLPTDGFSVVWPLDEIEAPGEILLEVAGFRYQDVELDELSVGMPVSFFPEPDNQYDSQAIRVDAGGKRIGYVKRQQCDAVARWLERYHVEAFLERFNGTAERPVVYVFCRLSQRKPETMPHTAVG
jgi:hypothetical protein